MLLSARGLCKSYRAGRGTRVLAVDDVDMDIDRGETLAVVGESGSGKSTLGRLVLRLIEADAGTISLDGADVRALPRRELRLLRKDMQLIFQDPFNSLDPRYTILRSVMEPLQLHTELGGEECADRAIELIERVGMSSEHALRLPRELSGGQLQRIVIARALAVSPKLIVCDEPVAALDLSIRAQVLNLLADLQQQMSLSYLFITHDLSTTNHLAHRIMVMRKGRVVEHGDAEAVFADPKEAYTKELVQAMPQLRRRS